MAPLPPNKTLREAISRDKANSKLYLSLIDVHNSSSHFKEGDILDAFDLAIKCHELTLEERYAFSQRKLDFLEELGTDPSKLNEAMAFHLSLECQLPIPPLSINQGKQIYTGKDENIDRKRARGSGNIGGSNDRTSFSTNLQSMTGSGHPSMNGMPTFSTTVPPPTMYGIPQNVGFAGYNTSKQSLFMQICKI
uniref:FRIGIDA-like protein n=1 Tax=Panagrolaimus superbus TaxID=310955 RepID=A0A914XY69_9BILA